MSASVLLALAVGLLLGALVVWLWLGSRVAAAEAQRDLLAERAATLESAAADDTQTAMVLGPLRDALGRVERQVGALEQDRTRQYAALERSLEHVQSQTEGLGRETRTLAGALNASSVRGAWGEVQLRRVLEHAGLLARCDFDEQVSRVSRHGVGVRPDAVVQLPGDKHLVIDAKAPMSAFLKAQAESLTPGARRDLLEQHGADLRSHGRSLAAKEYWTAFDAAPQMVVCFVPTDAMLAAALQADPSLHEDLMRHKVVLVGPGSLMALLRTVAFTWQQEALTESAQDLLRLGHDLYARLGTLGGHTQKMGAALQRSVEAYNAMVGTLESRVLVTARKMHEMGVAEGDLPAPAPVEAGPRVLTAVELLDAVAEPHARPTLDLDTPRFSSDSGRSDGTGGSAG